MSSSGKLRIIVTGLVGQYPLGGVAWDYFHYILGLHSLGHDVYYHEDSWCWPLDPRKGYAVDDPTFSVSMIADFFTRYAPHLVDRWHYLFLHEKHFGMTRERFDEIARTADVFINVSGACFFPDNLNPKCIKVFLDTDPGYNQIVLSEKPAWSENVERWCAQVREHDVHLTYAENIDHPDCIIPKCGIDWIPTRCVVTLPEWGELRSRSPKEDFTTIMTWSYFKGPLVYQGREYGAKAPEYDKFHDLPCRAGVPLTLAMSGFHKDAEAIKRDGWKLIDAWQMSQSPEAYREFIADSAGEWSIAKNVYVATHSGWFSCRTACYLASGRPAVVQDTKWSRYLPSGIGLIAFDTMEEAIDALHQIVSEPLKHRAAAYEIAREYLAPDRVLPPMLESILGHRSLPPQSATP